mgnify:CR=1 FL=1
MRLAMYGYAAVASHRIIENRYKSLGKRQEELEKHVGYEIAQYCCEKSMQYIDIPRQFLYHLSSCYHTTYQTNRSKTVMKGFTPQDEKE